MNAHVGDGERQPNDRSRSLADGTRQLGHVAMHLWHGSAAHGDRDGVPTGVTRVRVEDGMIVSYGMVVHITIRPVTMTMRRGRVVMFRVIVIDVLVHVDRRGRGRRYDQTTREHGCDETVHEDSLLRAFRRFGTAGRSASDVETSKA